MPAKFSQTRELPPRERRNELAAFQKAAGLKFKSIELLNLALTHRSCGNEDSSRSLNNERLEFLGDAVLGVIAAARLYELLAGKPEGELARIKSYIVSEDVLSELARALGIDARILLGKGEELSGGRAKKAILADAMEAVIGAYYLDQGFDAAKRFVLRVLEPEIQKVLENRHRKDYKTILQEYVQRYLRSYPAYKLARRSGPDHDRTFWVICAIGDREYGPVSGKNKKEAEQNAARTAYDAIIASGGLEAARLLQVESQ
jgi:ribonuclease-3